MGSDLTNKGKSGFTFAPPVVTRQPWGERATTGSDEGKSSKAFEHKDEAV